MKPSVLVAEDEVSLSNACDAYVAVVPQKDIDKDSKLKEELIAVKFKSAYIYQSYYHFDEAAKRFGQLIERWPESEAARKGAEYTSLAAELKLLSDAAALGGTAELQRKVEQAPDDHQARYDLALALNAEGERVEAAEQLAALMKRDRTWNDDGARKKLLEFFEAWGAKDPATLRGRRLLSSLLFS